MDLQRVKRGFADFCLSAGSGPGVADRPSENLERSTIGRSLGATTCDRQHSSAKALGRAAQVLQAKPSYLPHALRRELGRQAGSESEGDRLFLTWLRTYVKN